MFKLIVEIYYQIIISTKTISSHNTFLQYNNGKSNYCVPQEMDCVKYMLQNFLKRTMCHENSCFFFQSKNCLAKFLGLEKIIAKFAFGKVVDEAHTDGKL